MLHVMKAGRRGGETSRSGLIAGLLLSSIVLAGVLTWQAQLSMISQRAAAEKVLRDYAMLAADELARRSVNELGFYGFYPIVTAVRQAAGQGRLPTPAKLRTDGDEAVRLASDLVRTTFRYDPSSTRLDSFGSEPDAATRTWISARLAAGAATPQPDRPFVTVHGAVRGKLHSIVFVAAELGAGAPLVGFEAEGSAFVARFRNALERGPLFPKSLLHGAVRNDSLFLRLLDPTGREVFSAGSPKEPYLGVERPFGADYNGILDGFVIRAAVDPAAAPALVIGGLPRSRLPFLVVLLALTAGLSLTAVLQLRREQALSNLRSDFVSRVSHELRTPLTQIRMFTETLLLDRVRSDEERRRSLEIIDRESRRLTNLVENVLRFSRGERGEDYVEVRARDVVPLVRQMLLDFEPFARDRARLLVALPEQAIAQVDESALHQILLNLLDNAVKYGPEGQEIRLELRPGRQGVQISVEDQGPGIPLQKRELVWQRFYRLPRDLESAIAGTGIGLAVVRDLVDLLGGRAFIADGNGQGARFVVELRAGRPEEVAPG
ncbi:MAG TPA: HAMP domain-containing sensor histidine kinase [Thermoanaerobaculia bacterium]|nr:HAMP domain-containing sensor histidine kinase [Thermoanaerobaculia bacterium]